MSRPTYRESQASPLHPPPAPENTCAIVVLYFPPQHVETVITHALSQVARVIVVDNTDTERTVPLTATVPSITNPRVTFHTTHKNLGVAAALNLGVKIAHETDPKICWALSLDQDTELNVSLVAVYADIFWQLGAGGSECIFGCSFTDPRQRTDFAPPPGEPRYPWREVRTVITSGMMFSIASHAHLGGFDGGLFMDMVDHDFCFRARSNGMRIIRTVSPMFIHSVGHQTEHFCLPWQRAPFVASNHSPMRRYYYSRNTIILLRRHWRAERRWLFQHLITLARRDLLFVLFEDDRWEKLRATFRGLIHGVLAPSALLARKTTS